MNLVERAGRADLPLATSHRLGVECGEADGQGAGQAQELIERQWDGPSDDDVTAAAGRDRADRAATALLEERGGRGGMFVDVGEGLRVGERCQCDIEVEEEDLALPIGVVGRDGGGPVGQLRPDRRKGPGVLAGGEVPTAVGGQPYAQLLGQQRYEPGVGLGCVRASGSRVRAEL
ncbi:hypothetical protein GCM10020219_104400 [Nonomuraea dietziae]